MHSRGHPEAAQAMVDAAMEHVDKDKESSEQESSTTTK